MVKKLPTNAGETREAGSIPRMEISSGKGHDNPLQYACLGESLWSDRPCRLLSMDSQRVGQTEHTHAHAIVNE